MGYRYLVRHKRFHPPLLYPHERDFVLMGVMALCPTVGRPEVSAAVCAAERSFAAAARARGWHLYAQAENMTRSLDYAQYYGPALFQQFRAWKDHFDPAHRINRGDVFDTDAPPPPTTVVDQRRNQAALRLLLGV